MANYRKKINITQKHKKAEKRLWFRLAQIVLVGMILLMIVVVVKALIGFNMYVVNTTTLTDRIYRKTGYDNYLTWQNKEYEKVQWIPDNPLVKEIQNNFEILGTGDRVNLGRLEKERNGFVGEYFDADFQVMLPYYYQDPMVITKSGTGLMLQSMDANNGNMDPILEQNMLVYDEVYNQMTALRILTKDGIKEYFYLKGADAPREIQYLVNVENGQLAESESGYFVIRNKEGQDLYRLKPLWGYDVKLNRIDDRLSYRLDGDRLVIQIDHGTDLNYPLFIDPEIEGL